MKAKTLALGAGAGLIGGWAYMHRRELFAQWLHLSPPRYEVATERGLRIPMRDGIALAGDHYYPKARDEFPAILMRTPYGRGAGAGMMGRLHILAAQRFAERGYHVIVQDTRGRFDSEGEFEPFVNEREDGLDTLAWMAEQPWFNGSIGMWGQSYEGYVQWAVAADGPEYLKSLAPSITGSQIGPYTGTAFGLDTIVRWLCNLDQVGRPGQLWFDLMRMFNPQAATRRLAKAFAHLPIEEADLLAVGKSVSYYRKWLEHGRADDPFWQAIYHGTQMPRVRAQVHLVSGWYDMLFHQLLEDYRALRAAGHSPYLTIGPWRHLDAGGFVEALRAGITWSDAWLKGEKQGLRAKPVRLYIMSAGGGEWREFDDFPPETSATRWFLHADKELSTGNPPQESTPDRYRYDPADPTPAVGGPVYHQEGGARDNRALEARADVLTYTTAPLTQDLVIVGPVRLELYARSSLAHTDFFGRLCDVYADGRSMNICDGLVRLAPEDGAGQVNGSECIEVDMWASAYHFRAGHRIRLQVSSGAFPRWGRNLGTGEPQGTGCEMRAANQTIYHDSAHPSALILPVFDG